MIERLLRLVVGDRCWSLLGCRGALGHPARGLRLAPRRLAARRRSRCGPDIPFAPLTDTALDDPDNPTKIFRVDMARVEHDFPLTRAELAALTPGEPRSR